MRLVEASQVSTDSLPWTSLAVASSARLRRLFFFFCRTASIMLCHKDGDNGLVFRVSTVLLAENHEPCISLSNRARPIGYHDFSDTFFVNSFQ